ncbi:MAG: 2-oxo acid dehydrogenase subunit E2 [Spirochaeta sp.]|nr:2-oxo acid dehydrogenase subunit E2 [Spirochaeta sp.]
MVVEVIMPRQGQSVESCLILEWLKKEGDRVASQEPLCVVETDKATFEIEAPADGVLLKRFYDEGSDVPVLKRIALIGSEGEDISSFLEDGLVAGLDPGKEKAQRSTDVEPISAPAMETEPIVSEVMQPPAGGSEKGLRISPRAGKLAAAKGIDLEALTGSGPGGRILVQDIEEAIEKAVRSGQGKTGPVNDFPGPVKVLPVQSVRRIISEHLLTSLSTTAQYTLNTAAAAGRILSCRERFKTSPEEAGLRNISLNDLLTFITVGVLKRRGEINGHYTDNNIILFDNVHLGFAVDTPRGLLVPVIRFADTLSLKDISREAGRLQQACSTGRINPDELTGATFTLTNLGSLGIESFTPILNTPQVGILGVGSIQLRPVEREGKIEHVQMISLSLTLNHQVIDGAPGARFLRELVKAIESFEQPRQKE